MTKLTISSKEHFLTFIQEDKDTGCWLVKPLLQDGLNQNQYKRRSIVYFARQSSTWKRLAYYFQYGLHPPKGQSLHNVQSCPSGKFCCNPFHLTLKEKADDSEYVKALRVNNTTIIAEEPTAALTLPDKPIEVKAIPTTRKGYY